MQIFLLPLAAWLLLYAPGHYLLRRFRGTSDSAHPQLLAEVLVSCCATSVVGLLLAEVGYFSLLALLGALAGIAAAARGRSGARAKYVAADALGMVVVVLSCLWFAPPLDTRLLGADSTGYLASGIHLARHGSLVVHDPTLPWLNLDLKRALFPSVAADRGSPPYLRLAGSLVLRSLDADEVLPAFHHLLSVWVAVAYELGGSGATEWTIIGFAGLSLWAIVAFSDIVVGRVAAVGVWLALLCIAPQYWYSRFLMPEIPGQFLLWGGLWALAQHDRNGHRGEAAVAGVAFGVAGLMRLENAIFLGLALTGTGLVRGRTRMRSAHYLGSLLLAGSLWAYAALHTSVFRTHYLGNLQGAVVHALPEAISSSWRISLALIAGAALTLLSLRLRGSSFRAAPIVVALLSLGVAVDMGHGLSTTHLLVAFCGLPFVLAGTLGLLTSSATMKQDADAPAVLAILASIVLAQVLIQAHATPVPIWAIRRSVTVVVPALCLGAADLLLRRTSRFAGAALFAACVGAALPTFVPLWSQPLYKGARHHVAVISNFISPRSCVLMDAALAGSGIAPMLWAELDTPVFLLDADNTDELSELAEKLRHCPMYWLAIGDTRPPVGMGFTLTPVARYDFSHTTPKLEPSASAQEVVTWATSVAIYRVKAGGESNAPVAN
jgi:hypothetical protein